MTSRIIYASYASNMHTERFMQYIDGGIVPGSTKNNPGCTDKTPPRAKLVLGADGYETYFARNSSVWGTEPYNVPESKIYGGLALMNAAPGRDVGRVRIVDPATDSLVELTQSDTSLLAGYDISFNQFLEVMSQENKVLTDVSSVPDELLELLVEPGQAVPLKERIGENAIVLPSGETIEIDVKGAYSTLLYLGEIECDGQILKCVTFTSPFTYMRSAADVYANFLRAYVPFDLQDEAKDLLRKRIDEILPGQPGDDLSRLNPATAGYIDVVADGIVEVGAGLGDWTKKNALNYVLSKSPFARYQMPELAERVRGFLAR